MVKPHKQTKKYPPKRAYTPPNIGVIIFAVFFTACFTFASAHTFAFGVSLIIYLPLVFLGLFLNYHFGLTFAKINYKAIKQKRVNLVCLEMLGIQLVIIAFAALLAYLKFGFPIQDCSPSYCSDRSFFSVIMSFIMTSTIAFVPTYYAIWLYYGWVLVYRVPKKKLLLR